MYSNIKTIMSQGLGKLPSEVESLIWNHIEVNPSKLINHVKMYRFLNVTNLKIDMRQLNYINEVAYGSTGDDNDDYDTLCGICLSGDFNRYKKFKERTTNEDFKNMKFVKRVANDNEFDQVIFMELVSLMVGLGGNIRIINDMMPNDYRNIYTFLINGLYIADHHNVIANLINIFKVHTDNGHLFNKRLIDVACVFNDRNTFQLIKELKFNSIMNEDTIELIQFMAFNGCDSLFINDRINMIDWTGCEDYLKDNYRRGIRLVILAGRYERGDIPVGACSLEIIHMISDSELIKKLLKYHIDKDTSCNDIIMEYITNNNMDMVEYIINNTSYKLGGSINNIFKWTNNGLYNNELKYTYNNITGALYLILDNNITHYDTRFHVDDDKVIQDLEIAIGNMTADEIKCEYNSRKNNICYPVSKFIEENIFRIMEKHMAMNRRPEVEEKNAKRTKL